MSRKLLIVEDEENIRSGLSYALRQEGYVVFEAGTGTEALRLAREVQPELVLLDRMLPELDGVEVCKQLRKEGDIPVIMVTARDSEIDTVIGLEVGADDYITKPFSLSVLLARIKAVLRRGEARKYEQDGQNLAYGPFTLFPDKYVARKEGVDLELTPKLFELLLLMIKSPGRVFTRDELLEKVWGIDYAGESRTVDVHMTWLRKRLEQDHANPKYLITVRGVGYKIAEVDKHA